MSNFDTDPIHLEVQPPMLREPDALVENIYPVPGTETVLDLESQDVMAMHLIDRFTADPGPRIRVAWSETGRTIPSIQRVPDGVKDVSRWRKTKDWLISPKTAAVVMLGSYALFNTVGNSETINQSIRYGRHAVYRVFDPVENKTEHGTHTVIVPGEIEHISVDIDMPSTVGAVHVDPQVLEQFNARLGRAVQNGGHVQEITVTGNASDEWRGDGSIALQDSLPDNENAKLALNRATAVRQEITELGIFKGAPVNIDYKENVISPVQKADVLAEAQAEGYTSVSAAIHAADTGKQLSPSLGQKITQLFTGKGKRGVTLSADIGHPGKTHTKEVPFTKVTREKDSYPKIPPAGFYGFIPMLPIRRRERYTKVKQMHRWRLNPSLPIMRPELIKEDIDQSWIRLRPEAINDDGSIVKNAWAYTRKFEHLIRDGRIADTIRADYTGADGEEKSLRVMFVDNAPSQQTVDMFEGLLKKFVAMQDGKLGDRIGGIFVYPTENTGTRHRNPKRIGMGIDKQSSTDMLGTYTPVLDLVEMHIPSTWDPEELQAMFAAYNGPAWVASHEVAGHGTDENDIPQRARRIRTRNIANAHVLEGEPWAHRMRPLDAVLQRLPRRARRNDEEPVEFNISYPVVDNDGQVVTVTRRVNEHSDLLTHASWSEIYDYRPTEYSGESDLEHYAETAAAVTTGITVPYEEAHVRPPRPLVADNGQQARFAQGYRPDWRGQQMFTRTVGAEPGSFPVTFHEEPEVRIVHGHPANDPFIRQEMIRTSRVRSLEPHHMKAILARVARTVKK